MRRCDESERSPIDPLLERPDARRVMNPSLPKEPKDQSNLSDEIQTMQSDRMRAGRLALFLGILIFAGKFAAYTLTGSTAVFADAMESTINIVSAGMLVLALSIAARPPDTSHPYGHGKVEFVSAGIEGAAIAFAALLILVQGVRDLIAGPELQRLDIGLAVLAVSAVANAGLGLHLTRVGQETNSDALVADGRHVLADVWTSVGVIGGLIVVSLTGWIWADPLIAIAVAINVAWEGYRLLHDSLAGLMDEADESLIESTTALLEGARQAAWIDLHGLRSWRSGARRHVDLHLTVPRYFDVNQVHTIHDEVEAALFDDDRHGGDVVVHFDPCDESECHHCTMRDCAVRSHALVRAEGFTPESAVRPDSALHADPNKAASHTE
jgi:cation diffusion facilitator family transporter